MDLPEKRKKRRSSIDDDAGSLKSSASTSHPKFYVCICGTEECRGISSAFYIVLKKDARSGFTKLPRSLNDTKGTVESNAIREAYLRHLNIRDVVVDEKRSTRSDNKDSSKNKSKSKTLYVANHHFHPSIVEKGKYDAKSGKVKLPIFINENEMKEMNLNLTDEDKFVQESGGFFGKEGGAGQFLYYYAVPTYTLDEAQRDLRKEMRIQQILKEEKKKKKRNEFLKQQKQLQISEEKVQTNDNAVPDNDDNESMNKEKIDHEENSINNNNNTDSIPKNKNFSEGDNNGDSILKEHLEHEIATTANVLEKGRLSVTKTSSPAGEVTQENHHDKDEDGCFLGFIGDDEEGSNNDNNSEKIILDEDMFPPTSMMNGSDISRIKTCDEMADYENNRQVVYEKLFVSIKEKYDKSIDLIQKQMSDIVLIERIVLGICYANESYARAMELICNDTLLDKNNNPIRSDVVTYQKQQTGSASNSNDMAHAKAVAATTTVDDNDRGNGRNSFMKNLSSGLMTRDDDGGSKNVHDSGRKNFYKSLIQNRSQQKSQRGSFSVLAAEFDSDVTNMDVDDDELAYDRMKEQNDNRMACKVNAGRQMEHQEEDETAGSDRNNEVITQNSAIRDLLDSTQLVCKGFHENLTKSTEVATIIKAARIYKHDQVRSIERTWKEVFIQLDESESFVQKVWRQYNNKKQGDNSHHSSSNGKTGRRNSGDPESSTDDRWMAEMHYRLAVINQSNLWRASLTDLWNQMIETEYELRKFLQEQLKDYVPLQRQLFSIISTDQTPMLENQLKKLQISKEVSSGLTSDCGIEGGNYTPQKMTEASIMSFTDSLVKSQMFCSSKVIQRRQVKFSLKGNSWIDTLCVLTTDLFMHLFDLPAGPAFRTEKQAFAALIPSMFVSENNDNSSNIGKLFFKPLEPVKTYFLPDCTVSLGGEQRDTFEITEENSKSSIVPGLSPQQRQKCLYRTASVEETAFWIATLDHALLASFQQQR